MPECQKIKKSGLDQYGAERYGRLISATVRKSVGLKWLKRLAGQTHGTNMFSIRGLTSILQQARDQLTIIIVQFIV